MEELLFTLFIAFLMVYKNYLKGAYCKKRTIITSTFFNLQYSLQDSSVTTPVQAAFPLQLQFKISTKGSKNRILRSAAFPHGQNFQEFSHASEVPASLTSEELVIEVDIPL